MQAANDARDEPVVSLSGLLDGRRAGETRRMLWERITSSEGDVVIDLSRVESMDATVMTVLAAAAVRLRRAGRQIVLRGCAPGLRRLIAFRGWRRLFVWERVAEGARRDAARDTAPDTKAV